MTVIFETLLLHYSIYTELCCFSSFTSQLCRLPVSDTLTLSGWSPLICLLFIVSCLLCFSTFPRFLYTLCFFCLFHTPSTMSCVSLSLENVVFSLFCLILTHIFVSFQLCSRLMYVSCILVLSVS